MEDTLDSIVLILGIILMSHVHPETQKNSPNLPIHDEQMVRKSGCTSGIIVSTIADNRL
jgi:hypothetical protein